MRTTLGVCLTAAALLAGGATAFAQDHQTRAGQAQTRQAEGRQIDGRTVYDFGDADQVTGNREGPWGDRTLGRHHRLRTTLIRIRENFVPEALKSVERL